MEALACPRCGAVNAPGAKFCAQCSNPLPGDPSTPAAPTVVTVPGWLTRDWTLPIALAAAAALIGIVISYIAEIFTLIAAVISSPSDVPWEQILTNPPVVWSGYHGAIRGFPVLLTGLLWILVSFHLARRVLAARMGLSHGAASDRTQIATLAAKTGFVYMALVITVSSVVAAIDEPSGAGLFFFGGIPGLGGRANPAGAIFLGFLLGATAALITLARAVKIPIATLLGLRNELPRPDWLGAAMAGGRKTLIVAIPGMALFFYAATVIELLDAFGRAGSSTAAAAIGLIGWYLVRSFIDVGGVFLVNAMRFFLGERAVLPSGRPGWLYLSVFIVALAFFLGGLRAARLRRPADGVGAARAGLSTLLLVVPALFVGSFFWSSENGDDIIAAALFLPILWGAFAALGGWYHANQAGLPPGIKLQTAPAAPPGAQPEAAQTAKTPKKRTAPGTCPNCFEPATPAATFCSACGTRLKPR